MAWSRAASAGVVCSVSCSASATAWSTDSALGSGFGALGARRPSTGLATTQAVPAPPAVQAAPGRQRDGDAARRQAARRAAAPTQLRMWCGCAAAARRRPPAPRPAGAAAPRRTSPPCARPAGARPRRWSRKRCSSARRFGHRRSPRAQAEPAAAATAPRAGDLADAHQELGAHLGGVARGVGRAQHQQAEGWRRPGAAGSSPATSRWPASSSQPAASKPALTPQ